MLTDQIEEEDEKKHVKSTHMKRFSIRAFFATTYQKKRKITTATTTEIDPNFK